MKTLHVIPAVPVEAGGPTVAVFSMARALRTVGVDAEIATTDSSIRGNLPVPLGRKLTQRDVSIYYFCCPAFRKYGFSMTLNAWLRMHIREYDLIHVHGVFAHPSISAVRCARAARVPYILRPCGELDPWCLRKNASLKRLYLGMIGWRMLNQAHAIHATSAPEKSAIERLKVKAPLVVIPLGTDLQSPSAPVPYGDFRKRYPCCQDRKIILFLSRIDPKKGLDLLFESLGRIDQTRDDFAVVVAGSGSPPFERRVHTRAKEMGFKGPVIFCGFLDGEQKWAALRDADLFVLPSYDENFGVAVVEAMAMGLPVLISDQVGIHQEVIGYEAGVVTRCNVEDVTEALVRLLDDDDLRRRMGENAKRLVREKFVWPRVAGELLKLYQSILHAAGQRST